MATYMKRNSYVKILSLSVQIIFLFLPGFIINGDVGVGYAWAHK